MTKIIDTNRFRDKSGARNFDGGDGGNVDDDVLRRLGLVETIATETRVDVSAIKATISHLATKADIYEVRGEIGAVRAEIHALEAKIIRWIVGTTLASASLAFTIAKFVH